MQQQLSSPRLVTAALFVCLAAGGLAPAVAAAQSLAPGSTLTFGGTADAVDVGAAGVVLTFGPAATGPDNTGDFAGVTPGTVLSVRTVTVGEGPQPVTGLFTVGGYTFHLTGLPSGRFFDYDQCYGTPAAGQRCSPIQTPGTAISPFELENFPTGDASAPLYSSAAFRLVGTVTGPDGGPGSEFTGIIASFLPGSYQQVLGGLEQAGPVGLAGLPYQAAFVIGPAVTVTPEPTTFAAAGAGLLALAAAARRRRARQA